MEEKGNGSCSKFVLEIKARKNGLAEGINHRAKIRTSRKLGFRFLSSFRISFEPATCHRAFSHFSPSPDFCRVVLSERTTRPTLFFPSFSSPCFLTTVRKFRGNRISRSQEVSTIKQTRLSKLHEITRQRSRTFAEKRTEWIFGKL